MKHLNIIYILIALAAVAACTKNSEVVLPRGGKVRLCAAVGDMEISSKAVAEPFLGGSLSPSNPLAAAVWFRKSSGDYANVPEAEINLPAHTHVAFAGPELEYVYNDAAHNNSLKYPVDGSDIHCIGLYPDDEGTIEDGVEKGWKTTDNRTVTHIIDGSKDLMFAKEIVGNWNSPFNQPLQYNHLLTWIKINICATSHEAVDAWGKIMRIYISSDRNVQIDLKSGECTYIPSSSGVEADAFIPTMYKLDSDPEPITLSTATQEVGSVLCSPEKEYMLWVVTMNKSGQIERRTVNMKLTMMNDDETITDVTDERDAIGKCFVFSLYFTPYSVIEGVCSLNSWNNQNDDIYLQ